MGLWLGGGLFITICTAKKNHYFGEIEKGIMQLSHIGVLADVFWHEILNHAVNVELGAFVVMPNHIHGILILTCDAIKNNDGNESVETRHALSLNLPPQQKKQNQIPPQTPGEKRFQNQGKNTVSSILGS